jgi:hypothetical protein
MAVSWQEGPIAFIELYREKRMDCWGWRICSVSVHRTIPNLARRFGKIRYAHLYSDFKLLVSASSLLVFTSSFVCWAGLL